MRNTATTATDKALAWYTNGWTGTADNEAFAFARFVETITGNDGRHEGMNLNHKGLSYLWTAFSILP